MEGRGLGVAENIDTVRRFYRAGAADDDTMREQFFAPDAVWHVPGNNPVSGPYHGVDEIRHEMARRMEPLTGWWIVPHIVMGNDDMVVAIVSISGIRRGREIDTTGAHAFRFGEDGRIVEAWGFSADQARLDDFFRA
jgi:ketosteroid isomerase-like protein